MHSCGFGSRTDEGMKPDDKEINTAMCAKYSCPFSRMCFLKSLKLSIEISTEKEKPNEQTHKKTNQPNKTTENPPKNLKTNKQTNQSTNHSDL